MIRLRRPSNTRCSHYTTLFRSLPAAGQGALALVARADDEQTLARLQPLDHAETRAATTAERAFLAQLDRKSTRLNSSHRVSSYAVICLKKTKRRAHRTRRQTQR